MSMRDLSLALFALLLAGVAGCGSEAPASGNGAPDTARAAVAAGTTAAASLVSAPDFDLGAYEGQVVLLNFWATWCAPCRAEMPDLVELQRDLGPKGLQIIGVAMDQTGKQAVAPYLEQQPVNYPIVLDPDAKIGQRYGGIPALPTTLLIGPGGEVQRRIVGRIQPQPLRKRLDELLASESEG